MNPKDSYMKCKESEKDTTYQEYNSGKVEFRAIKVVKDKEGTIQR